MMPTTVVVIRGIIVVISGVSDVCKKGRPKGQACCVHVGYRGDWDEPRFREYLLQHENVAKEYKAVKLNCVNKYRNNRDTYTDAKTEFIEKIKRLT
jgi:GrpB-like predicted nucleotidyltransferase (UPF0157 family)